MNCHNWISEEVDCGSLGIEDFWVCRRCGADGGMSYVLLQDDEVWKLSIPKAFINEKTGGRLYLPDDCDEAIDMIEKYRSAKNVAVFGGSFNPVTWGHVTSIINLMIHNQLIDEVIVAPCYKQHGKDLIDFHHRYKMCQLAFQNVNHVSVSDIEAMLGGESHTHRLVTSLKEQNPNYSLRFIIGEDLKDSYKTWKNAEVIDKIAPPLIISRPGFSKKSENVNISSTVVREYIKNGRLPLLEKSLPGNVLSYILDNKLYI